MSAAPVMSPQKLGVPEWRSLYLTALFETDKSRLPGRILRAERALMIREHQLFTTPANTEERMVVTTALNALHALRRCHERC